MDTDDLAISTYAGVLAEAEAFNHDLTLQFGVLASLCDDDDDYLNAAEQMIQEWLEEEDFQFIIDDIFFGNEVDFDEFRKTLHKILANIAEIRKTPMGERAYEDWG